MSDYKSKYFKKFDNFRSSRKELVKVIEESVMEVNNSLRVKVIVELKPSLINAYVSKVKEKSGKDLRANFGTNEIAEELVKWVAQNYLNVDSIPETALIGGATTDIGTGSTSAEAPIESAEDVPPATPPAVEASPAETPAPEALPTTTEPKNSEVKVETEFAEDGEKSEEGGEEKHPDELPA